MAASAHTLTLVTRMCFMLHASVYAHFAQHARLRALHCYRSGILWTLKRLDDRDIDRPEIVGSHRVASGESDDTSQGALRPADRSPLAHYTTGSRPTFRTLVAH